MNTRQTPTQIPQSDVRYNALRGRPLMLARVAWVVLAATVLGLDAAGIPYTYALTVSRAHRPGAPARRCELHPCNCRPFLSVVAPGAGRYRTLVLPA
jgi:hypothetical protein